VFLTALVPAQADPDLWGHVRFGLDLLASGHLRAVDSYSFTQDVRWINHEWLSELLMAAAFRIGSAAGLVAVKVLLAGSALVIVARRWRKTPPLVMEAMVGLALWGALPLTLTIRPQLWTFLGIAALCAILANPSRRRLRWLPIIFLLWANLHGGWIVGLAILLLWTGVEIWRPSTSIEMSTLLVTPLLSIGATLINPYGTGLWLFLVQTVRLNRGDITEWYPLWTTPVVNWLPWTLTIFVTIYQYRRLKLPLSRVAPLLALAYGSATVARLAPLFVEAGVIFLSPPKPAEEVPVRSVTIKQRVPQNLALINAAAFGSVCVATILSMWKIGTCIRPGGWRPDAAAAVSLQTSRPTGKLAVWFDWGEYALWHLSPGLKVSVDGRRETLYSEETLEEQRALSRGDPEGLTFIRRAIPDYVWFPASKTRLKSALPGLGYRIEIDNPVSFVAVRSDRPPLERVTNPVVTNCFPGP
jgi:hypothetical protein